MTTFRPCFLIPCYNHGKTVPAVVESLMSFGYPMLIVDDGSNRETKQILADVTANNDQITLITLAENQGKGGAVIAGIEAAYQRSFSHAIQIDADGQHYLEAFGLDFQDEKGGLDYVKIDELLSYDIVHPFVNGGGAQRDFCVFGLIKLLEFEFQTTLGFHEKLNENQVFYAFSASKRAEAWRAYLETLNEKMNK